MKWRQVLVLVLSVSAVLCAGFVPGQCPAAAAVTVEKCCEPPLILDEAVACTLATGRVDPSSWEPWLCRDGCCTEFLFAHSKLSCGRTLSAAIVQNLFANGTVLGRCACTEPGVSRVT
jgi:hypothetical protein